jgi:hypothetical protein
MSDPMLSTDETRPHACPVPGCGAATVQRRFVGAFAGGEHWSTDQHTASCGLPCYSAGAPGRAYRTGEYHRDGVECPRCGPASEIRARLRAYRERAQRFESGVRMAVEVIERGVFGEGINQLTKSDVLLELKEMLDEVRQ